jgi:hypothetical protein
VHTRSSGSSGSSSGGSGSGGDDGVFGVGRGERVLLLHVREQVPGEDLLWWLAINTAHSATRTATGVFAATQCGDAATTTGALALPPLRVLLVLMVLQGNRALQLLRPTQQLPTQQLLRPTQQRHSRPDWAGHIGAQPAALAAVRSHELLHEL